MIGVEVVIFARVFADTTASYTVYTFATFYSKWDDDYLGSGFRWVLKIYNYYTTNSDSHRRTFDNINRRTNSKYSLPSSSIWSDRR